MVLQSGTTKWTIHNMRTKRALRESVPHRVTHIIHPASNRRDLSFDYMLALALKRWNPSHRSKSTNSLQWPLKRKEETKHATSLYVTLEMNNKYKMTTNKYKVQTISHVEKQEIISFFLHFFRRNVCSLNVWNFLVAICHRAIPFDFRTLKLRDHEHWLRSET